MQGNSDCDKVLLRPDYYHMRSISRVLKRSDLNRIVNQPPLRQTTETTLGPRYAVSVSEEKMSTTTQLSSVKVPVQHLSEQ